MTKKVKIKRTRPAIKYSGSLIQQGYAEALIHGMLVWDTSTSQAEFIEIPNDICYYTLEIDSNSYTPIPIEFQNKTIRLRIKVQNTETADLKKIIAEIKTAFNIEEYTIQKINDFTANKVRANKINIGDVRDVEHQNDLITKYLENKFALDDTMLDGIRHVNRTVNSSIPALEISRNVSWIPKRFEFSNMFSYGPDNVIDFTDMKGVYGIFAPNASGKSTMLDSITYCIFDKCGRTSKAASVLNNKSSSFKCKFNFELDGKSYFIEKTGTKGRGEHVRVDVDFYMIDEFGQKESLNGKERSETNDHIRHILGTYEDFVLTALSVQNNNSGFIDMAQKDRKDLLAQFLDINIFEDLHDIASKDIKEVATLVKDYQKQDYSSQLATAVADIQTYSQEHKSYQIEKKELETEIANLNDEILKLTSNLVPVDSSIEDITALNGTKEKAVKLLVLLDQSLTNKNSEFDAIAKEIIALQDKIKLYNIATIQTQIDDLEKAKDSEKLLVGDVAKLNTELSHKLDKMKKLNDLKYDENCSFCMDNIFVKDAIATKASIETDKKAAESLSNDLNVIKTKITTLTPAIKEKDDYSKLQKDLHVKQLAQSAIKSEIHQIDSKILLAKNKFDEIERQIVEYYKKEAIIKSNALLKDSINTINSNVVGLQRTLDDLNSSILKCHSKLIVSEQSKIKAGESIDKLKDLEKQYKFYQYYLEAVDRDGVPYDLISMAVPYIEQEINSILSQLVDFNLMLEMDGKNINCYIVYDQDNFWPIELTSGMEKFISSLAIRAALINVSSLPRPNFLAIDEGFGSLDADNLNSIFNLFDYLKSQFSFMLVISHIDSMRDVVDKLIEIVKTNGNSKIYYE